MSYRSVPIDAECMAAVEAVGLELLRADDPRASKLLSVVLRWKVSREIGDPDFPHFACDVDESAGLAEVVELQSYSRKAPCA